MEDTEIALPGSSNKNAKIMAALYALAIFVFCFGGLVVLIIAASGRERDGVLAAKILAGPASFAISGFLAALASMFFLKGKDLFQILVPLFVSMVCGVMGWVMIFIFFGVIWRLL